ncbi:MAG: hypothetical protein M1820_002315 [Bogoriella megaspora]|nr:MAG: hypothetical protein M1820_002315 [Bogoriella megaspora]
MPSIGINQGYPQDLSRLTKAEPVIDVVNEYGDHGAHVLDVEQLGTEGRELKTAGDGRTVLIPQPSADPNDPLNWNLTKKHVILAVISLQAFVPDYGSAAGVVTLLPQATQWDKPQNTIQHALVGNSFCLGMGGLFVVWLSAYFGRLPVLVVFSAIGVGTAAWSAAATTFESYMAARIVNGFFSIVAQAGGLMFIQDLFFFHEHPRKINLWSGPIIASPYLGPLISAFIVHYKPWPDAFWVFTAISALAFVLVLFFAEETIYNRNIPPSKQPIPRSHLRRILGIEQWQSRHSRQNFLQAVMRPIVAISKLPVLLCVVFYFLNFAWVIGVNATISIWLTSFYHFTPYNLGFFYFAPVIGSIVGAVAGHWLHDQVGKYYMKRHNGHIEPEARLIIVWLATPIMAVSVLVLGYTLERRWHWSLLAIFMAGQVVGIMIATTALNAYLLDSYPEGSGEVGAWIVVGRTQGGFMSSYIEINWVKHSGPLSALGTQTGIVVAAALIVIFLGLCGKKLRKAQGRMRFAMESGHETFMQSGK